MTEQYENIRELVVAIFLGLYGTYTVITGILIVLKKKEILDPAKYIQIGLMKLSGNTEKAQEYEQQLKEQKNWPQYGIFVIAVGGICIIFAFYFWMIFT